MALKQLSKVWVNNPDDVIRVILTWACDLHFFIENLQYKLRALNMNNLSFYQAEEDWRNISCIKGNVGSTVFETWPIGTKSQDILALTFIFDVS